MRLEFHPEAELELIEAAAHYEREVPGLGERFTAEVQQVTDLLLDYPAFALKASFEGSVWTGFPTH